VLFIRRPAATGSTGIPPPGSCPDAPAACDGSRAHARFYAQAVGRREYHYARHWSTPAGCNPGYEDGLRSARLSVAARRRRGLDLTRLGAKAPVTGMYLTNDIQFSRYCAPARRGAGCAREKTPSIDKPRKRQKLTVYFKSFLNFSSERLIRWEIASTSSPSHSVMREPPRPRRISCG
jgi:hypothetical protein